jgi:MtN3 and saliva related transmembrane protein
MLESLSGWIGTACIVLCWIPQTMETLRNRQCNVNRGFLLLATIGTLSLTVHSVFLNDVPFIILNTVGSVGSGINLFYSFHSKSP